MVARIKPAEGARSGRITSKTPNAEDVEDAQGKRRQRGELNDGFGTPVIITPFGGCEISYREKSADHGIWARRYYIGFVQFAYVRKDPDGYIVHLTGQDDAPRGKLMHSEAEVDKYLRAQLVLA